MYRIIGFFSLLTFIICGCGKMNNSEEKSNAKYFLSPRESVPIITELLQKRQFKTLAKYYDLSYSQLSRVDLESGEFFIRKKRPEISHPAGFWQYKHPFAPGFKFHSIQSTEKKEVYLVRVMIEIEQGEDAPEQMGFSDFYMIKSVEGWRILPDRY